MTRQAAVAYCSISCAVFLNDVVVMSRRAARGVFQVLVQDQRVLSVHAACRWKRAIGRIITGNCLLHLPEVLTAYCGLRRLGELLAPWHGQNDCRGDDDEYHSEREHAQYDPAVINASWRSRDSASRQGHDAPDLFFVAGGAFPAIVIAWLYFFSALETDRHSHVPFV